jgi:hypothetical protein
MGKCNQSAHIQIYLLHLLRKGRVEEVFKTPTPALLTRRSIVRRRLLTSAMTESTASADERSAARTTTCTFASARNASANRFSVSSDRATKTRLAPFAASCRAKASPKPEEAPVMRAVRPSYVNRPT